jgi:hypothetical protein
MQPSLLRQRSAVLARRLSLEILSYLSRRPYSIASEVADSFNIHIATAQKYLSEMEKARLVASRLRATGRKPAREFYLLSDRITLEVDFTAHSADKDSSRLGREKIREAGAKKIAFEWDPGKPVIKDIILLEDQEGRRTAKRVPLEEVEGRFLWNVPLPGEAYIKATEVAHQAGISDPEDLRKIEQMLDRLLELGVIEKEDAD